MPKAFGLVPLGFSSLGVGLFCSTGNDSFQGVREVRCLERGHSLFRGVLFGRSVTDHPLETFIYERILGWIERVVRPSDHSYYNLVPSLPHPFKTFYFFSGRRVVVFFLALGITPDMIGSKQS